MHNAYKRAKNNILLLTQTCIGEGISAWTAQLKLVNVDLNRGWSQNAPADARMFLTPH